MARFVLQSGMASIIVEWRNRAVPRDGAPGNDVELPLAGQLATAARVDCIELEKWQRLAGRTVEGCRSRQKQAVSRADPI